MAEDIKKNWDEDEPEADIMDIIESLNDGYEREFKWPHTSACCGAEFPLHMDFCLIGKANRGEISLIQNPDNDKELLLYNIHNQLTDIRIISTVKGLFKKAGIPVVDGLGMSAAELLAQEPGLADKYSTMRLELPSVYWRPFKSFKWIHRGWRSRQLDKCEKLRRNNHGC